MYAKGVPEKLIAETSGHKSLKALRAYEQTSSVQEKAAGECTQLGKQYEEAQDSDKEQKPFVATATILWTPQLYIQLLQLLLKVLLGLNLCPFFPTVR